MIKVKTYKDLENLKIRKAVVTVGIFDGVHTGHSAILERVKTIADEINGESVVVTFWPHPRVFLTSEGAGLKFLNTFREKKELLKKRGINHCIIIPFTREFSNYSSGQFIKKIIVDRLKTNHLIGNSFMVILRNKLLEKSPKEYWPDLNWITNVLHMLSFLLLSQEM